MATATGVVYFTVGDSPTIHSAVRVAGAWRGLPPFWGAALRGVHNRRAGAQLVIDGRTVRVRILERSAVAA